MAIQNLISIPYDRNTQLDGSPGAEISNGDDQNSCESPSAEKNEIAGSDFKAVRVVIQELLCL